jgi:hypothetical protein
MDAQIAERESRIAPIRDQIAVSLFNRAIASELHRKNVAAGAFCTSRESYRTHNNAMRPHNLEIERLESLLLKEWKRWYRDFPPSSRQYRDTAINSLEYWLERTAEESQEMESGDVVSGDWDKLLIIWEQARLAAWSSDFVKNLECLRSR